MNRTRYRYILFSIILCVALASPATAALVSYNFAGHFTSVSDATASFGVTAGDTFAGSFTYDTNMAVASGSPGNVVYERTAPIAPLAFDVTINGVQYSAGNVSAPLNLQVTDNAGGLNDQFVYLTSLGSLIHPLTASYPNSSMALTLRDTSETVFSGTTIPNSLDLNDFDVAQFNMNFFNDPGDPNSDNVLFLGTITHLSAVPEPSAILLLIAGLTILWITRGRRIKPARASERVF